jgi:hypothetical protein
MKIGDKVRVNDKLQIEREDEKMMIGQEAEIIDVTDFVFPIRIRFINLEMNN